MQFVPLRLGPKLIISQPRRTCRLEAACQVGRFLPTCRNLCERSFLPLGQLLPVATGQTPMPHTRQTLPQLLGPLPLQHSNDWGGPCRGRELAHVRPAAEGGAGGGRSSQPGHPPRPTGAPPSLPPSYGHSDRPPYPGSVAIGWGWASPPPRWFVDRRSVVIWQGGAPPFF